MNFQALLDFLHRVPAIDPSISHGQFNDGNWWVKFHIDTKHALAWHVVQELGHVLNYLSDNERLPALFMPVSPPPYLNGGPEFLSWVIESKERTFTPDLCAKWLEVRLPTPVEELKNWEREEENEDEEDEDEEDFG